jgi:HPt (histidine-containing phosphotransfer) domain-containing protein
MLTPSLLPLFDPAQLDAMTGGDSGLAAEVIEIFLSQLPLWQAGLSPDRPASDWADTAHTLKGASLSLGALRLAEACAEAERLGRQASAPDRTAAATLLAQIHSLCSETRAALQIAKAA